MPQQPSAAGSAGAGQRIARHVHSAHPPRHPAPPRRGTSLRAPPPPALLPAAAVTAAPPPPRPRRPRLFPPTGGSARGPSPPAARTPPKSTAQTAASATRTTSRTSRAPARSWGRGCRAWRSWSRSCTAGGATCRATTRRDWAWRPRPCTPATRSRCRYVRLDVPLLPPHSIPIVIINRGLTVKVMFGHQHGYHDLDCRIITELIPLSSLLSSPLRRARSGPAS